MSGPPDFIEPVVAWRLWLALEEDGVTRLSSIFQTTRWPQRAPLLASCQRIHLSLWPFRRARHEAPDERCGCGIYATSAKDVRGYLPSHVTLAGGLPIVGRVSLWGTVCECERGWRASHAYPEQLYVPIVGIGSSRAAQIVDDLRRYGVPVRALDGSTAEALMDEVCALGAAA